MRGLSIALLVFFCPTIVFAAECKRNANVVTCGDGRTGIFTGDTIVWPDGTRSTSAQHPSVKIGHKDSVRVGSGVFVGSPHGKGSVPLDDPNAPHKRDCAVLDSVSYC